MQTIVVGGLKGGSGKDDRPRLTSPSLPSKLGHGPIVVIDTDPQGTLSTWWQAPRGGHPENSPRSKASASCPRRSTTSRRWGFVYAFIDTPPALSDRKPRDSDPGGPRGDSDPAESETTFGRSGRTLDLLAGKPFVFALTQAKSTARITMQSIDALSEIGHVLPERHTRPGRLRRCDDRWEGRLSSFARRVRRRSNP